MPILLDTDQVLVRHADATVTPEAVVYRRSDDRWRVAYQGGVNNLYASLGNRRDAATEHWLREAIDVALVDGDVTPAYRRPLGCFIERRP
jgi:hypothetical protein